MLRLTWRAMETGLAQSNRCAIVRPHLREARGEVPRAYSPRAADEWRC